MKTLLLDTHVIHWLAAEHDRLSKNAVRAIEEADDLAVSSISWWELAWLGHHEKIALSLPVRSWLERLSAQVRTIGITPNIAETAAALPDSFPGDPGDRLIFATAIEEGAPLVTKDRRIREHQHPGDIAIW
jgi:PIN domain nuclease of toxin-antitoxin system